MNTVDEYIATCTPAQTKEFERINGIVKKTFPAAKQGTSYGMPAHVHKGKGLISFLANKNFLSVYPFSGKVIQKLSDKLSSFECTTGSIHFSVEKPIPEALLKEIIVMRLQEIENKTT